VFAAEACEFVAVCFASLPECGALGCAGLADWAVSGAGASLDISARTVPNGDPDDAWPSDAWPDDDWPNEDWPNEDWPDDGDAAWGPTEVAAPILSGKTGAGDTA
jgi:hypothetical protein